MREYTEFPADVNALWRAEPSDPASQDSLKTLPDRTRNSLKPRVK